MKCAGCGKKPRVQPANSRASWKAETTSASTAGPAYTPSSALKQASTAASMRVNASSSGGGSVKSSPKKSPTSSPSIFDKLTDTSLYTGTHQHRFTSDGQGRGLEGRDSPAKGHGLSPTKRTLTGAQVDLSSILRPDEKFSPLTSDSKLRSSPPKSPVKAGAGGKGSIFDKLTDPSLYTGAHRQRFDSGGNGRGMMGRDAASGIEYGGGKVSSLSQITRTNLR